MIVFLMQASILAESELVIKKIGLMECYQLALKRSETIAIEYEEIEESKAAFLKAASEALGDVNFVIDQTHQDSSSSSSDSGVASTFTRSSRRERRFTFAQPVFQGFRALGALSGAGSLRSGRRDEWIRAKELLFLDVSEAFYAVLENYHEVQIIEEIQKLFEERLTELKDRENIGRSRPSESLTATSRRKILDAELALAKGELATSEFLLSYLTGTEMSVSMLEEDESELGLNMDQDLKYYLSLARNRADLRAQEEAVKTSWRNVIIAQSDLWPKLTLEGNHYEKREGFQSGIDWDLLFRINIPIFQGGEVAGNIKSAVSNWNVSKLRQSRVSRESEFEVRQAYENWSTAVKRSKALQDAVTSAEENFRIQKDEYLRNLVSNLDVLEALESLNETKRGSNLVFYDMKTKFQALRVSAGGIEQDIHS